MTSKPIFKAIQNTVMQQVITALPIVGMTILTSMTATSAMADNLPKDPNAKLGIGANVMIDSSPYDVKDAEIRILPSVYYDNNVVYARGNRAGVYLINNKDHQVDLLVTTYGHHFDPNNINNDNLKGLKERDSGVAVGASYTRRTPIGAFRLQASTDVTEDSDGIVAKAAYLTRYNSGNLTLYPSIGVAWYNDDYNDYYYSVNREESIKTGVTQYAAKSSINPYISLNANYQFDENWAGFFGQSITYLGNEQYDSPLVVDRANYRTTLGVTYTF